MTFSPRQRFMATLVVPVVVVVGVVVVVVILPGSNAPLVHETPGVNMALRDADATDLALERVAMVTVRVPWTGTSTFSAALVGPGGRRTPLGRSTVAVRRADPVVVRIRLAADAATLAQSCARDGLALTARGPNGQAASVVTDVDLTPPTCGRFFSPSSFWNVPLASNAVIDPDSKALTATLVAQVDKLDSEHFYPNVNTDQYSVPIYTVAQDQPRVPVVLDNPGSYAHELRQELARGVPIPAGAKPAAGTDAHLVVWQPGTNTMWELWRARLVAGRWYASFGGEIPDESGFDGAFFSPSGIEFGATASSLALAGGLITFGDIHRGQIDHAVAVAIPSTRASVWALPASRTDGVDHEPNAIPEGARFRLPPSLNIASLHLSPIAAMIARAAQRYGMFVRDQSGSVSFYAQDPTPTRSGIYHRLFEPDPVNVLSGFPWGKLEVVKMQLRTFDDKPVAEP